MKKDSERSLNMPRKLFVRQRKNYLLDVQSLIRFANFSPKSLEAKSKKNMTRIFCWQSDRSGDTAAKWASHIHFKPNSGPLINLTSSNMVESQTEVRGVGGWLGECMQRGTISANHTSWKKIEILATIHKFRKWEQWRYFVNKRFNRCHLSAIIILAEVNSHCKLVR